MLKINFSTFFSLCDKCHIITQKIMGNLSCKFLSSDKMLIKFKSIIFIICASLISISGFSQEYLLAEDQSSITVQGTSSLHDWVVEVQEYSGNLILDKDSNEILGLKIKIVSKSLKGTKKVMNRKIYNALKADDFGEIIFINDNSQIVERVNENENKLKLNGNLIIAGVRKEIQLVVNLKQRSNNIIISGTVDINMEDYSIKPPKALFGTVKVNEIVSISFDTVFK